MFANESFALNEPALPKKQNFDYAALENKTRLFVQERTKDIKEWERSLKQAAWEIGRNLVEVRECLISDRGLFASWLRAEFQWSERTAYNYIAIYQSFPNPATVATIEIAMSSLYLLASPSTPEEARLEVRKLAENGRKITPKEVKAVVARHKQPDKPRVVGQLTVEAEAETVERELLVVAPIRQAVSQSERQEVLDSTFIEFDDKQPTRYATPQPLGNYAVEDEEQDEPELIEEGLVTEIMLPELPDQVDQLEKSSPEVQGKYSGTLAQPQEVDRTEINFSAFEENEESSEVAMLVKPSEQEFEETVEVRDSQTTFEKIYSFLISQAKEYVPNFPNVRFFEVDEVIKQIAQDTNFRDFIKSGQLGQDQLEEVQQAFDS